MKQILSEEFKRMQKLAGIINENKITKNNNNPTIDCVLLIFYI